MGVAVAALRVEADFLERLGRLAFGVGLSAIEVPYATFAALADLCETDSVA